MVEGDDTPPELAATQVATSLMQSDDERNKIVTSHFDLDLEDDGEKMVKIEPKVNTKSPATQPKSDEEPDFDIKALASKISNIGL